MPLISTTLCYPTPAAPTQGIFVQRRLAAINELMPLRVVAPALWFPGFSSPMGQDPAGHTTTENPCGPAGSSLIPRRPPLTSLRDVKGGRGADATAAAPRCDSHDQPPVWRPRMFYLPGVFKSLDARFYACAFARGLREATRDADPTLIDAHFEWPDGIGAWLVARKLGLPFVCTLRGKLVSQIAHPSKRRQIREMLLSADALIAVSHALADLANEVAGRDLGVRVIPNGVETTEFCRPTSADNPAQPCPESRAACGWADDAKYVVSVGHLQTLKGWHRLVEIWPEVRRRAGDIRLVVVGGEAGEPAYARRVRGAIDAVNAAAGQNAPPAITLTGRVPPARVASMLNAADLFALTSQSEGWCNALAEALACGCPAVATDVGGNREIITDDRLGLLTPLDDRAALTDAICRALSQPWDRRLIADLAGHRNWQQVAAECADVFREVLKRRA